MTSTPSQSAESKPESHRSDFTDEVEFEEILQKQKTFIVFVSAFLNLEMCRPENVLVSRPN